MAKLTRKSAHCFLLFSSSWAIVWNFLVFFLGGLSLHLNHLIVSCMTNYNWPFGTLPFGLFGSIWTQGTLRHILRPILVIFEICQFLGGLSLHLHLRSNLDTRDFRDILGPILVIFEKCQFLTIPGPFEYFSENGWSQKIKIFSMKERSLPPYRFSFRRRGP